MSHKRGRKTNNAKYSSSNKDKKNYSKAAVSSAVNAETHETFEDKMEKLLEHFEKLRPIDYISGLFVLYMFTFYLIYMDDMYFNITFTRANVFWKGSLTFIVIAVLAYLYDLFIEMRDPVKIGLKKMIFIKDTKIYKLPELWMGLFFLANVFAYINAENKLTAWTGESGRYFGLKMIFIAAVMFFLLSRSCYVNYINYFLGLAVSIFAVVMAYVQHFGADPFKLKAMMREDQRELFISLFGNINTYGSFLAVIIPMAAAMFIFSKKYWVKCITAAGVFILAIGIIPAKSDNVYLGVGAAMLIMLFVSIYYKRLSYFMVCCDFMLMGLFFMAHRNLAGEGSQKHINGIAEVIESPKIMMMILIGFLVMTMIVIFVDFKILRKLGKRPTIRLMIILGISIAALIAAVCVIGVRMKLSLFVFNDQWGTLRGYIWRRGVSLFERANPMQKLFGYGNETISQYMTKYYNDEMLEITKRTYDNLHNEFLQYLVTTGIFGALTYVGLFISGISYLIKNSEGDPAVLIFMAGVAGYWVQGLVYLNQPITTPLYFVLLAAGIGYIRFKRRFAEEEQS